MFEIVPYLQSNGAYTLNDNVMLGIWQEICQNGIKEQVFYEGGIKDAETWMKMIKHPSTVLHTIWSKDFKKVAMVAWLNSVGRNHATCHQFCMPWTWGKHTVELGKMTLDYWFDLKKDNKPILDTIIGKTPEHLRAATIFLRKMGLTVLGMIPHIGFDYYGSKTVGIVVSYITREEWRMKNG